MPTPKEIERAVSSVRDRDTFVRGLLAEALEWENADKLDDLDVLGYGWTPEDLRAQGLERHLLDGHVWQIQLRHAQPWGIFLIEFAEDKAYRTVLRKVLRGLVPSRRRDPNVPAWNHENLLFICATRDYDRVTFAHFRGEKAQAAKLATFGWQKDDRHLRTLCEYNLSALEWPDDNGKDKETWLKKWATAFDVEAVTKRFFGEYAEVFHRVEASVKGVPDGEPRRLYTQRLFNRLLFLYFIQRKGWLSYQGDKRYLRALFNAACKPGAKKGEPGASATGESSQSQHTLKVTPVANAPGSPAPGSPLEASGRSRSRLANPQEDFLNDRLYWTFFYGLNTANEDETVHSAAELLERRGEVPFLNGGLFDLEDRFDEHERVKIPNASFAAILDLFERYNFTVTESTPLDVEVAVDPEMLGKVFEELVTGRHETGSYYTPRPVVAFMCRESLKHYLLPFVAGAPVADAPGSPGSPTIGATATGAGEPRPKKGEPGALATGESLPRKRTLGVPPVAEGLTPVAEGLTPVADAPGSPADAVARFVDDNDPSKLTDPEAVLAALKNVKVCDPACGSGAYLLGMMQELLRLREALFAAHHVDQQTVYDRKLEIIQNNLYGVDIDLFAVNIAKLRLWLSLAVDFTGTKPPPLPNLDFKIECGDSLTAPDPQKISDLFRDHLVRSADRLADLKARFLSTYGAPKKTLKERIEAEEAKLREHLSASPPRKLDAAAGEPGALATGVHPPVANAPGSTVDWRVAFAEVLKEGGFDIALANPLRCAPGAGPVT
jgi:MmeI, DNA-methyltransferase domain